MCVKLFKEDLQFLYDELNKHSSIKINPLISNRLKELFETLINEVIDYKSFINSMTTLTNFFNDGHTNIELPYTLDDKCLNIPCIWDNDRLITNDNTEILAIENMSIEKIIELMADKIPHENKYLVMSRMINYPYKNYHIFSKMNLEYLFGSKDYYDVTLLIDDKLITKHYCLENYNGYLDFKDDKDFISYEMINDSVILHLDSCIYNDEYKNTLKYLVNYCNDNNIKSFILDLSKNMGGSSAVIDEFIKYVSVDEYRRYEMVKYSDDEVCYITKREDVIKNQKSEKCFNCDIYCKVSYDTFSSARTFAVTLKDNNIAKIIGQPTGGKPNSFGMPNKYATPNYNIRFRVSSSYFLRPDSSKDDLVSLFPDE